LATQSA